MHILSLSAFLAFLLFFFASRPAKSGVLSWFWSGPTGLSARVTSRFGEPRKTGRPHSGLDFALEQGTKLLAIADGTVAYSGFDKLSGGYVAVDYALASVSALVPPGEVLLGLRVSYAHCSSVLATAGVVKVGQVVAHSGGKPGTEGAGSSTGPHLHVSVFLLRQDHQPERVDPGLLAQLLAQRVGVSIV